MDERNAISRLKQGDLSGLEKLVEQHQVQAVHAAYLILFDRALAEDATASAFVKVVERIDQFDETRPFAPWFFRIVVNDALKLANRQKRSVSLEDLDDSTTKLAKWLTDPMLQPEQLLEEKQTRQNILKAIESLPSGQRAVIVMRYYLDMSEADMSSKMERPLSSIKWWLRDARKRLHDLMDSKAEGE
jgi:RNA polymerase sigma-70 factor (ECF subfamily)